VQAKENDEEKRISRQANQMISRKDEEVGLDARHRQMLRHLESMCDMTHSCVSYYSFTYATWHIHMSTMTHSYVWRD